MGEKGNGGHVPTGGTRQIRTATDPNPAMGTGGMGGSTASAAGGGGGGLLDNLGDLGDIKDAGSAAFGHRERDEDEND